MPTTKDKQVQAAEADAPESSAAASSGKVRVLFDAVTWLEPREGGGDPVHRRAKQGDLLTLPSGEVDRLLELGAVVPEGDYEVAAARFDTGVTPEARDEELLAMSGAELVAYVNQNPTEARRVFMLERGGKQRPLVLQATGIEQLDDGATPGRDAPELIVNPTGSAPTRLGGA